MSTHGRWWRAAWVATVAAATLTVVPLAHYGSVHGVIEPVSAGAQIVDRQGRAMASFEAPGTDQLGYWPLDEVPPRVAAAVVALEDRSFHQHHGVDPLAIVRAAVQNLRAGRRVSGASTIAMQLARLQRGPGERGWWRKLEEASTALFLTARHTRTEVMRAYLERVPYGNRLHGIAAAARVYLDKPVDDLSWAEIAFMSAIPQAPALSNPWRLAGAERARTRGRKALDALHASGVITARDRAVAAEQLARLRVLPRPRRDADSLHAVLAARARLQASGAHRGRVETTVDMDAQRHTAAAVAEALDRWRSDGATQAAALVVDLADFSVRAWVGSGGYGGADAGAMDFVQVSRSPGSTLKPFIYALALDRGRLAPDSLLQDTPSASGFRNADQGFLGPMLPRQALANSRNLPAVRVLARAGLENSYWMLRRLHVHRARYPARHYGLGLALGAMPVTLEALVTGYGALASDGMARPLRWFRHEPAASHRVLGADSARLVTRFLADPQARLPMFQRLGNTDLPFAAALKTGTSQGHRDAWTVAWTPHTLVGVWLGRADNGPMHRVTGARAAAVLAGRILAGLPGVRSDGASFPAPAGYRATRLCANTGEVAHAGCPRVTTEWLRAAPRRAVSQRVAVDRRTGVRATSSTPGRFVVTRPVFRFPPVARNAPGAMPRQVIVSPADGLRVVRLPDVPADRQSLALRHRSSGPVQWFVDGVPFRGPDGNARWTLVPGRHVIGLGPAGAHGPEVTAIVTVE